MIGFNIAKAITYHIALVHTHNGHKYRYAQKEHHSKQVKWYQQTTALSFNAHLCCHKSFILWLFRSQIYRLNEYNILRTNEKAA